MFQLGARGKSLDSQDYRDDVQFQFEASFDKHAKDDREARDYLRKETRGTRRIVRRLVPHREIAERQSTWYSHPCKRCRGLLRKKRRAKDYMLSLLSRSP